ncbi:hypothetical protein KXD40_001776 [Peronospora effusa]|uniref:DNA polymerase kappa n=1 Tax=Peronospora effusa TaxID=542832 RepID=A0A3R7W4L8_9STRA|nr:hypothetical protein DD237_005149 [Peronospora effusa]UIZ26099.1 hypothetical protein KXD40_001776 [Peronospora effusa]CAI5704866.1 unnamed protein product [Peronospora effusa]
MSTAKSDKDALTTLTTSKSDVHLADEKAAVTSSMFVFTADKAGMKDVNKQHVQEVVHKMSKDSSFYQKSLRDNEKVEQRVIAMREKLAYLTSGQLQRLQSEADARMAQMEATRDLSRTIVVVDMDMFYAAVEMRDNPKLRDVPLAVGGLNMISTTNYAARQFGVRAAMPGFIGKELCPELHFVPVNMEKYKGVAAQIRAVFVEYDPEYEAFSLDEACLDLTEFMSKNWQKYILAAEDDIGSKISGDQRWVLTAAGRAAIATVIVRELRAKIYDSTQLTASAGIAVNTMLAKICSDINKPNGQYILPFTRECVISFIHELPVRKIGGIGKVTEKILNDALDVKTGAELFAQRGKIAHLFSKKTADWLLQTSLGVRERREKQERKSFSRERTFPRLGDPKELEAKCEEICKVLAKDLEKADKAAKNVTLVYKDTDFARCSRSMTLASAVFTADDLFASAVQLLRRELPLTLRLMGVRAATLVSRPTGSSADNSSQTHMSSKKRQTAINKFAEQIDHPAAAFASGDSGSNDRNMIKKAAIGKYFSASVTATSSKKSSFSCPEYGKTLSAGTDNSEAETHNDGCVFKDDAGSSRRKRPRKTDIPHAFAFRSYPKSTPVVDNKPCPICGKLLNTGNNMEVNAHMDACIVGKNSSPLSSPLQHTKHKKLKAPSRVQDYSKHACEDVKPWPICGKSLNIRSSMEVNAHMDACVARDQLPPVRIIGKKRSMHEASKKKLENSIDVFFRKNYND